MQALCRSYLRGIPELLNCRNPQQTKTTTFFAAMKVFSYLAVPLPIIALVVLATCKVFSKKPPNNGTANKTEEVANKVLPQQKQNKENAETASGSQTTTTAATTTPNPNSVSKPPSPQALKQTVSLTPKEIQRAEILKTAQTALGKQQPIMVTLENNKLVFYRDNKSVIRLKGPFDLKDFHIKHQDGDSSKQPMYIIGKNDDGFEIHVPLNIIKSVIEKK